MKAKYKYYKFQLNDHYHRFSKERIKFSIILINVLFF